MIEVELWDRDGIPLRYIQVSAPLREIYIPTFDAVGLNYKNRRFQFRGKSADLTDSGVSVRLVYEEV
jgi:hypothetical protein